MKRQGAWEVGDSVPRRGGFLSRTVARSAIAGAGWKAKGHFPDVPKCVLIVAPHTSNWDFLLGMVVMFCLGVRVRFLAKHTLFRWPLGCLMRWLGGMPVDRTVSVGVVAQTVARFQNRDRLFLGVAPEGTRNQVARWKTGFYHIACEAAVPIVSVCFDYGRREVSFGPPFIPTGNVREDIAELASFFTGARGRRQVHELRVADAETPATADDLSTDHEATVINSVE